MSEAEAKELEADRGYQFIHDEKQGFRRVVASPKPVNIVELDTIKSLVESNHVVISCGGGGIPVTKAQGNHLKGAAAVIDKDFAAEKLAEQLDADALIILTAVEKVAIGFGTDHEQWLDTLTAADVKRLRSSRCSRRRVTVLPARPVPRLPATLSMHICTIEEGDLRRGAPSFVLWRAKGRSLEKRAHACSDGV